MAWSRCFVRGENFPGELVNEPGLVGFYVIRFVEAPSAEDAESHALQVLRSEPKLAPPPDLTPSGLTRVHFEQIEELDPSGVPAQQPGFTWYPMDAPESGPRTAAIARCPTRACS